VTESALPGIFQRQALTYAVIEKLYVIANGAEIWRTDKEIEIGFGFPFDTPSARLGIVMPRWQSPSCASADVQMG
jgi:hypothetical protein